MESAEQEAGVWRVKRGSDAPEILSSEEEQEGPRERSGIPRCGFASCLCSSDHDNCLGWAAALQPNPRVGSM